MFHIAGLGLVVWNIIRLFASPRQRAKRREGGGWVGGAKRWKTFPTMGLGENAWRNVYREKDVKNTMSQVWVRGTPWENNQHFAMPALVCSRKDLRGTNVEIRYWWHVNTHIWVVLLIGRAARKVCLNQSESLPQIWVVTRHQYGPEFLRSFLRRHFASKPVVASRNVGCFLRLVQDLDPRILGGNPTIWPTCTCA